MKTEEHKDKDGRDEADTGASAIVARLAPWYNRPTQAGGPPMPDKDLTPLSPAEAEAIRALLRSMRVQAAQSLEEPRHTVHVRLTTGEVQRVHARARHLNTSTSELMRSALNFYLDSPST